MFCFLWCRIDGEMEDQLVFNNELRRLVTGEHVKCSMYKKIDPCLCPNFESDRIHLDDTGMRHIYLILNTAAKIPVSRFKSVNQN